MASGEQGVEGVEIRKNFHHEMDEIRSDVMRMGGMVSEGIARCTRAFLEGDLQTAEQLIDDDDAVDAITVEVEERCFQLLALQQPMAKDMRAIVTAIRLAPEIERTHDLLTNIAKATRRLHGTTLPPKIRGIVERMGGTGQRLFRAAMDAYADEDTALADALDDMDDEMDDLQKAFIQQVLQLGHSAEQDLEVAVQLALVARYYERIGDHAVNMGERVHYLVTGWLPEHTGAARLAAQGRATSDPPSG